MVNIPWKQTFTNREDKVAIQQLMNNKAAVEDGIGAELKIDSDKLAASLHRLKIKIWEMAKLSDEWRAYR